MPGDSSMEIIFWCICPNVNKLCSSSVSSHVRSSSNNFRRKSYCFLPPTPSVLKLLPPENFVLHRLCNRASSATKSFTDINLPLIWMARVSPGSMRIRFLQFQVTSFSGHPHFYCLAGCMSFWLVMSCLDTIKLDCCKEYACSGMEEVLMDQYCMIVFLFCFFAFSVSFAIFASRLRATDLLLFNLSSFHNLW